MKDSDTAALLNQPAVVVEQPLDLARIQWLLWGQAAIIAGKLLFGQFTQIALDQIMQYQRVFVVKSQ